MKTMHLFCFRSRFFAWGQWGHWGHRINRGFPCPQSLAGTGDTGDKMAVIHSENYVINRFLLNIVQFAYNSATSCARKTGITFEAVNVRARGLDSTGKTPSQQRQQGRCKRWRRPLDRWAMGRAGRAPGQGVGFGIYLAWCIAINTATRREGKPRPPPYRAGHHSGAHGPQ